MNNHPISILIADNENKDGQNLSSQLRTAGEICLYEAVQGGFHALDEIYRVCPDIIVMDITLAELDGIGILRRMTQQPPGKFPRTILLVEEDRKIEASEAFLLGAQYCFIKPIDYGVLKERICTIIQEMRIEDGRTSERLISQVREIVIKIGAPVHKLGYSYFIDAVLLIIEHSGEIYPARDLYEDVAVKHNTTWRCVESNLRNATSQICELCNEEYIKIFFIGHEKDAKKLSNFKMISKLAEYVKIHGAM